MLKWIKNEASVWNSESYSLEKNSLNVYASIERNGNQSWSNSDWVIRIGNVTINVRETKDVQFLQAIANSVIQAILKEELRKAESD